MKPFITLKDVVYEVGGQVVFDKLNLSLDKGKVYAVIGPSGVGKTTLLYLLAGFIKPSSGQITIAGDAVYDVREQTSFLFQDLGLFPWQTATEAVKMPLEISKDRRKHENESIVNQLLGSLNILSYKDQYPHQLSGGQKQRVALARTLVTQPDLLLMDEPTSALDAMTKETIQQLFLDLQSDRFMTSVFVTHDIEEAVFLGDEILLLHPNGHYQWLKNKDQSEGLSRETKAFYDQCFYVRKQLELGGAGHE
ncbi:NitT/TauT family transport system ATP-binding protein [Halolactibacillus halophilus]|uniref:ABC transporter ATP-binding protein n=1 Tax=Halolactibacillus halophilus TaxID=306540 RepID=A0A1I5RHH0_9BACI|nr:ABC transporter ATP-binding protein [Halolactibacillus halophilus]GEM02351.1 ABC transporter ATP-binding protein [Halolactibacillus halophilus]SFP57777.1 NitT/TauT family transport system ATP-binding protein [Halolactibacillus halophilus]